MNAIRTAAAIAATFAAFANPSFAADAADAVTGASFDRMVQQYQQPAAQGEWHNPYLPQATSQAMTAVEPKPALPAGEMDRRFSLIAEQYRATASAAWTNPYLPDAAGALAAVPADVLVARILTGYTRGVLDRGGWVNPYLNADHYAAGAPLLDVAVGEGVTTRTAATAAPAVARDLALAEPR